MQTFMRKSAVLLFAVLLALLPCGCKGTDKTPPLSSGGYDQTGAYQPPMPDVSAALKAAQAKNSDVVGWLTVPNTEINEAVVQTTNNDYYLRRNVEKKYAYEGCYYLDYESVMFDDGADLAQNSIIYGHNLGNPMGVKDDPNAAKFAQLLKFDDIEMAKKTPYIYFATDSTTHVFEIFAVLYCEAEITPVPYHYAEYNDEQFTALVADLKARSLYTYDVPVAVEDKIMILSTCSYKFGTYSQNPDQRYIVVGRQVKKGEAFYEEAKLRTNENPKQPVF